MNQEGPHVCEVTLNQVDEKTSPLVRSSLRVANRKEMQTRDLVYIFIFVNQIEQGKK